MKSNIFLFYILRAFYLPFFWLPVLYIYLTSIKGLNPAEAALLLSLQELLLIFLEIPTGVIADKVSRKFSIGLGYILTSLPFLFLPFTQNYTLMILIFAVKATGKALVSGADTSLLYDTLVDLNKTNEYKRIINKSKSLMMGITAICILLGGFIAQYDLTLTLILPFPLMIIGALAAFGMKEPEISKKAKQIQDKNYFIHTLSSFRYIINNKILILLMLIFAITEAAALNMKWYYTPIFEALKLNLIIIGSITALLYVIKSVLSALSVKLIKDKHNIRNIILFSTITAIGFIIPTFFFITPIVIICLMVIIFSTEGLLSITQEEIHKNFESHNRATSMSIVNLFSSLIATITLNGFGIIQLHTGIKFAILFIGLTFLISTSISLVWKKMILKSRAAVY